jgi:hypothetical protein
METQGLLGPNKCCPARACELIDRRPTSRNTHYYLTDLEAVKLREDSRVLAVEPHPEELGIKAGTYAVTQTSNSFDKSNTINSLNINWALLRCTEGQDRTDWGRDRTPTQTGTIGLSQTGKGVDIVVVDGDGFLPDHPEFSDGAGGTRATYYNWYQHNSEIGAGANGTYVNSTTQYHPIHVMGTTAGVTQGWARDAKLHNIYYDAGNTGNFSLVYNYVKAFHLAKPVDPTTGLRRPTICNNSWGWSLFPADWSFSDITAVTYRGVRYTPASTTSYTGVSGVFSASTLITNLLNYENGGNRIVTTGPASASVTSITNSILGAQALTSSTTPTTGSNDDGYWTISLPWAISYLGTNYYTVCVGTNFYLTMDQGSVVYTGISSSSPPYPKIMLCADDRSVQRIYYGVEDSAPNRRFRIRVEGHTAYSGGVLGSPTMVCEWTFYENAPNTIDLQVETNNAKTTGSFSTAQLNAWGFIANQRLPQRIAALDADLEDAIKAGVITVGAAGNGLWKHDVPGGLDWNNTFEMAIRYPGSAASPYYYMRGSSPTANDNKIQGDYDLPNICVGAIDVTAGDYKSYYSDCGPGVDIWAPGTSIMSSWNSSTASTYVPTPANSSYNFAKISGTSMASPQVCGVLACALEKNPHWNQRQAKDYITGVAKGNQVTESYGGPADIRDLQGAPNLYLYYRKERPDTGQTVPKQDQGARPVIGHVYPRSKIHRYP